MKATKTFADNTISRIIHMVEEAQEKKGKSQRFIERFGARYSPIVLLIGALVIGAVAGFFTLLIAVLGHEISEFVVIGSGLRMLRN